MDERYDDGTSQNARCGDERGQFVRLVAGNLVPGRARVVSPRFAGRTTDLVAEDTRAAVATARALSAVS